ncbi:MAG TPA: thioesterase domain-containing protein [Kineosporiaceae bacterium]
MTAIEDGAALPLNVEGLRMVWCVPPSSGSPTVYLPLADAVDGALALFGLMPAEQVPAAVTLMEVVQGYARQVDTGNDGALLGWSLGGALAFEVGRWLHARRGVRPALVLLDTEVPSPAPVPDGNWFLHRFAVDLLGLPEWPVPEELAPGSVPPSGARATRERLERAWRAGVVPLGLGLDDVLTLFRRFRALVVALSAHRPSGSYPGPVLHLQASAGPPVDRDWSPYASDLRTVVLRAEHHGLLTSPSVDEVATQLVAWLEAVA